MGNPILQSFTRSLYLIDALLPVMVWIHGGGFVTGSSGETFHGPQYFMESQEVVLVYKDHFNLGLCGLLSFDFTPFPTLGAAMGLSML